MAPEQAEGLKVGAAADVYSLALVTYEALTGVNPVRTEPPPSAPGGSELTCRRCAVSGETSRTDSAAPWT